MRDINLKTLRLLVAVCEHQNIARAAELEHIEPSAISKRIAQLEADLGATLLTRTRRGVSPTPAGQAVLEHARSILFSAERMSNDALNFNAGVQGQVRMFASPSAIAESLLDDISVFLQEPANRNIKVDVEERYTRDLVRQVREGLASVGVCWDRGADLQGLQFLPYRSDHLALAVHADHPLAHRTSLAFEETLDHAHVSLGPMSSVHVLLQQAAARAGKLLEHRIFVSNFDAALRVVRANLAVSVVPAEAAQDSKMLGLRLLPLTDPWAERHFIVCYNDLTSLMPAVRRMVDHLVARAAEAQAHAGLQPA